MNLEQRIDAAAAVLMEKTAIRPEIALVLGSGLGDFADTLENPERIPYCEVPGIPQPTAPGHTGAFVFGYCGGKAVAALQGRLHYYEGHSMTDLTLPIRVLRKLGIRAVVLTNAAGGVNESFRPGDLMLISDHINFSGYNPLIGPNVDSLGPRFPDVTDLYGAQRRQAIKEAAAAAGIPLQEGVYVMFTGPNYETPAEVRCARIMGGDAVGMSTVPEALVAGHCGMEVVGVSCITNMAAGITGEKLTHTEVMEIANLVHDRFESLVKLIVELL